MFRGELLLYMPPTASDNHLWWKCELILGLKLPSL